MELKTKIDAEPGKQDLVITRAFDLPCDLVFKAYTEPELVAQWMETNVIKLDSRNHGSYRFEKEYNGQVVFSANGTIHTIVSNTRIVRTFEMAHSPVGVQLEFLEFEALTANTSKLTIHIIYQSEAHRAAQLKLPFGSGLNTAHNRLEEILQKQTAIREA